MLKALMKAQVASFFAGFGQDKKTGKKRKVGAIVLFALLYAYLIGIFLFLFTMTFASLGMTVLADSENAWVYFATAGVVALLVSLILSIFATVAQLYEAKDNDLLLSMPIPPRTILLSRLLFLLLETLALQALVLLPALVMYLVFSISFGVFSVLSLVAFLLGFIALPLLSLTLSCLFGWLVAQLMRRVRRKSLVQTVFSLIFIGAYFYFYISMMESLDKIEDFSLLVPGLAGAMKSYLYPFYLFGLGCTARLWVSLLFLLLSFALAASCFVLLSRSFIRVVTAKAALKKAEYREKAVKPASVRRALAKKDLSYLFHSSMYLLNAAFGVLFVLCAAVALLLCKEAVLTYLSGLPLPFALDADMLALLLTVAICLLLSTVTITAPSVSLESKTLWLLRATPLRAEDVLFAKVYASRVLTGPAALLASLSVILITSPAWYTALAVLLLPQAFALTGEALGMIFGVLFPRFSWVNEAEPVKQGASVLLTMVGMLCITVASAALALLLLSFAGAALAAWGVTLFLSALAALFCFLLSHPVSRKFEKLYV